MNCAKNLCVVVENGICYDLGRMTLFREEAGMRRIGNICKIGRNLAFAALALTVAACAPLEEEDSTIGSRLAQPPAGTPPQKPIDAGDIAIVGQEVAHSIMNLPVVSGATVPPLVQFAGVTSIIDPPIDTEPYTTLLRDRLLLLTRLKLRFYERTLPPYVPPGKKGKKKAEASAPAQNTDNPDYQILAEMRGHAEDEFYRIQVQFVDARSNQVLFDGLYRIRKEAPLEPVPNPAPEPPDNAQPPQPSGDLTTPTTTEPAPTGGGTSL